MGRLMILGLCFLAGILVVGQDLSTLSSLPPCGQTCITNMLALAPSLGCSSTDINCLCTAMDFGLGLRDCTNESCPADVREKVIAAGTALCVNAGATASAKATGGAKASDSSSLDSFTALTTLAVFTTIITGTDAPITSIIGSTTLFSEISRAAGSGTGAVGSSSGSSGSNATATSSSSANGSSSTSSRTTTSSSAASPSSTSSPSHLSTGAKVGIGIGIPVAVLNIAIGSYLFWQRRRRVSRGFAKDGDGAIAHPSISEKDGNPRSELKGDINIERKRAELDANQEKAKDVIRAEKLEGGTGTEQYDGTQSRVE